MKLLVALACVLVGCLAQQPRPCKSPPQLSGKISLNSLDDELYAYGGYIYDAIDEKIRLMELVTLHNNTFTYDVLLLYREQVMYNISEKDKTCTKLPLKSDFVPLAIPGDATFVAQALLGDSTNTGEGLLVNEWLGKVPNDGGKLVMLVTASSCVPITYGFKHKEYGWLQTSYFDNVIGIPSPELLIPPSFCPQQDSPPKGESVDLISFLKQRK